VWKLLVENHASIQLSGDDQNIAGRLLKQKLKSIVENTRT